MAQLEQLTRGATVKGILPEGLVTIIDVKWIGTVAIEVTHKDSAGRLGSELLYRDREPTLEIVADGRPWSFDGDGALFRLVSEARRIQLAYLFDPLLAVHTSLVEPLPHQITAVYSSMLSRQPLRFLLADDPGAGKTIMTGLFIKELLVRGDLQRCLIVCPGNLVEQWQDELYRRFHLPFEIMTNDTLESARTGNWFLENPLAICRLDKLSRNPDVQAKLEQSDWDLIVCDEAHKMSATYFGNEVTYTKRYRLGQLLSALTRHFLLLTATPHNGKEADFQLFLALLDGDRFEGKFRDGVHTVDVSDLMRRLVKEQLLKFDGTPLFPERVAYTVNYTLSDPEARLYSEVTDYVRTEFNRAEALENEGRKGTVGFALTILQRRLASSPEAIYQSIRRRRERLEKRLREELLLKRGAEVRIDSAPGLPDLTTDDIDDLDDAPDDEIEAVEEKVVDQATASGTIAELRAEIALLQDLERLALKVRQTGSDRKWDELSRLLQNNAEMFDAHGHRRKLVIFTEHRDTLNYLNERISALVGKPEAVVIIHGGLGREERRKAQESFTHDKDVEILVATDAAGEGINLQRAHLMVNYDLPWNPNRLEQRFGRIHRIGQTEVCHLWNLVAKDTREGEVYNCLLDKINEERKALGGQVFDVLGQVTFDERPLRQLLLEAIRYGDQPDVKQRLLKAVNCSLETDRLRKLLESRALTHDTMDVTMVRSIREDMERAEARRLQPHFIASFFLEAFKRLGGAAHEREPKRYEVKHVPAVIRNRDRAIGRLQPILPRYERITFEKTLITIPGKPLAAFVCPGHPLLDATIDLVLERHRDLLKRGAVLVDEVSESVTPRALLYLEHSIQDARTDRAGNRRVVSRRLQFVEVDPDGTTRSAGWAPYHLDVDRLPPAEVVNAFLAEHAPPVLDPFCGGGSIPLEAQRLGLRAYASDLNPVPVLITKALIEIPPKFAGRPPVNPDWQNKSKEEKAATVWHGAQGLAADVRYYGQWMRDEAEKRIGHLYPKVKITKEMAKDRPDLKDYVGEELTVIAWLWARTVASPNPAAHGIHVPLIRSFVLATKKDKSAWVRPIINREENSYRFAIGSGKALGDFDPTKGTVVRTGGRCLLTNSPIGFDYIRKEGRAGRIGARLMAIVVEGARGRLYIAPQEEHAKLALSVNPENYPDTDLPEKALGFRVQSYGMDKHFKLFTARQLVSLISFSDLVLLARDRIRQDIKAPVSGIVDSSLAEGGTGFRAYADAVATYLALAISRLSHYWSNLSSWHNTGEKMQPVFARQAISMIWDFAEGNPFCMSSGNWFGSIEWIQKVLAALPAAPNGTAKQLDATAALASTGEMVVSTDPPYYDNIGYADLSDFFYIWLRRAVGSLDPSTFSTLLTPKMKELIAAPYRHGDDKSAAQTFFEEGLAKVFSSIRTTQNCDYPLSLFYAFKQSETDEDEEGSNQGSFVASTGWETILESLVAAGVSINGTWPMRTEMKGRARDRGLSNALASSIILVCRSRPAEAPLATRKQFINALRQELPEALRNLQQGNIAPVDLAQASIGPGMAVFTRYAKVMEADGRPMSVRTALGLINQSLDEVLAEQEGEFDAETRWAVAWFEQYAMNEGPFGVAETLSRAKNTAVNGLVAAGIIEAEGGKVRFWKRAELGGRASRPHAAGRKAGETPAPLAWDPATDKRLTAWEVTQYLIRALEQEGESGAAALVRKLGGYAETARDLAYRLYSICERKKWAEEALAYNGLVIAWPELTKLALAERNQPVESQGEMFS